MRIGSLFSGAGGLDMAVEQVFAGETVWHSENDSDASKVLAARWPSVPNLGDITKIDWTAVEPVDVLCGGWPCQPFSLAGRRKGANDERALWPDVAGAVRMVRPRIVVLENVSAVLGPEFQRVADDLAALGYDMRWTCLRASDIGAPHRRERLFVVAYSDSAIGETRRGRSRPGDTRRLQPVECGSTHRQGPAANPTGDPGRFVNGDSGAAAHPSSDGRDEERPEPAWQQRGSDAAIGGAGPVEHHRLPTPCSRDYKGSGSREITWEDTTKARGDGGASSLADVVRLLLPTPQVADGAGGHMNRSGDRKAELLLPGIAKENAWGKYGSAIRRWESLTRSAPPPAEPNRNNKPRLNPAFSEWMMGWPAGWVTDLPISRNAQLRIIGNGVVPLCAAAALTWLLNISEAA